MANNKFFSAWSGMDDKIIVREMLKDSPERWQECREAARKIVESNAKNILPANREDVVQDAMIRVYKSLHTFKHKCAFSTWLFGIILHCIIDAYRKSKHGESDIVSLDNLHNGVEHEDHVFFEEPIRTIEEEYMTRNELAKALEALTEYISTHANSIRNEQIIVMVKFEGHSLEEAAIAVGCSAPVAGYVVRSAEQYVREKLGS